MKLEQSFEVRAPVERVWSTLIDVESVAPCLPGAKITGSDRDGTYHGDFSAKLGPATAAYRGTLTLEKVDQASRTVMMKASGQDKRGQGAASATIESRVIGEGAGSRVEVVTDFTITGRLARFGRGGLMEDIANRMLRDFASCLESRIGSGDGGDTTVETTAAPGEPAPQEATEAALSSAAESAAARPTAASPEEAGSFAPAREPANARSMAAPPQSPAAPLPPAGGAPAPSDVQPVRGFSLLLSVILGRIRRLRARAAQRRHSRDA